MAEDIQAAAITALLERSKRSAVPIRRSFVQRRTKGGGRGPLAAFVTARRRRALDLYLLVHAVASAEPWDVELSAVVWARLLGLSSKSAGSVVTRQWAWLESQKLVRVENYGRKRRVFLLREDGSGEPYTHPGISYFGKPPEGDYFALPHAYWRTGMQEWADLPTKAVLLISASLQDGFLLPREQGARWYGVSPDTIRTGLRGLQTRSFLSFQSFTKPAPLSPKGYTVERRYRLESPFRPGTANDVAVTPASPDAPATQQVEEPPAPPLSARLRRFLDDGNTLRSRTPSTVWGGAASSRPATTQADVDVWTKRVRRLLRSADPELADEFDHTPGTETLSRFLGTGAATEPPFKRHLERRIANLNGIIEDLELAGR